MHLNTWSIEGDAILGGCNHLAGGARLEEVGCWVYDIEISISSSSSLLCYVSKREDVRDSSYVPHCHGLLDIVPRKDGLSVPLKLT